MSDSIQTSIYKFRPSIAVIDSTGKLIQTNIDLNFLEKEFRKEGYEPQKIQKIGKANYEFKLFYSKWDTEIKWKDFIAEIAVTGEDILENNVSVNEGFILLVSIKKKNKKTLYAITGGFGHTQLQSFIDYQFGLDIISRLIKTDDKVLRAAKERNIVGGVLGSVKYFRGDYNLNENESFGNYYHELRAKLNKSLLKSTFKFTDDELKRGGLCDAKTSFTIRKPLTFERAIEIVDILDDLIRKPAIVDLNLLKKLNKSDKALIEKLEKELEKKMYDIYKGKLTDVNIEICHRIFDKYYDAQDYEIEFPVGKKAHPERIKECYHIDDIFSCFNKMAISLSTQSELYELLNQTKITCFDEAGNYLTTGKLLDHCCAELKFKNRSYFVFNQEWYLVKPDFTTVLNNQCQDFIKAHQSKLTLKKWNVQKESENDFNGKHIGDINTLVFDKVTPENIEVCDILKWNANEIYFIHVKEGFNNEMRNLGRQVHISARRIIQDLKSGKIFLAKLYEDLVNMTATTTYFNNAQTALKKYSKKNFLELFDTRKPVFILAILDSATKARSFADITKFDSNIAKFCLHQLSQEIRLLDGNLQILEVEK